MEQKSRLKFLPRWVLEPLQPASTLTTHQPTPVLMAFGNSTGSYLELVDEIISLEEFITDVLQSVTVGSRVDSKDVERPVFNILSTNSSTIGKLINSVVVHSQPGFPLRPKWRLLCQSETSKFFGVIDVSNELRPKSQAGMSVYVAFLDFNGNTALN